MADAPPKASPTPSPVGRPPKAKQQQQPAAATDEESTIKVASSKAEPKAEPKAKPNGIIKLKKPAPKHTKPGNWKDGSYIDSKPHHYPLDLP